MAAGRIASLLIAFAVAVSVYLLSCHDSKPTDDHSEVVLENIDSKVRPYVEAAVAERKAGKQDESIDRELKLLQDETQNVIDAVAAIPATPEGEVARKGLLDCIASARKAVTDLKDTARASGLEPTDDSAESLKQLVDNCKDTARARLDALEAKRKALEEEKRQNESEIATQEGVIADPTASADAKEAAQAKKDELEQRNEQIDQQKKEIEQEEDSEKKFLRYLALVLKIAGTVCTLCGYPQVGAGLLVAGNMVEAAAGGTPNGGSVPSGPSTSGVGNQQRPGAPSQQESPRRVTGELPAEARAKQEELMKSGHAVVPANSTTGEYFITTKDDVVQLCQGQRCIEIKNVQIPASVGGSWASPYYPKLLTNVSVAGDTTQIEFTARDETPGYTLTYSKTTDTWSLGKGDFLQ